MVSSSTIASSVDAAGAAADSLKAGLEAYHSFKLGSATGVADGTPPTTHDSISDAASSYCAAYASAMERDAGAFRQVGISLDEADAMAAADIQSAS